MFSGLLGVGGQPAPLLAPGGAAVGPPRARAMFPASAPDIARLALLEPHRSLPSCINADPPPTCRSYVDFLEARVRSR